MKLFGLENLKSLGRYLKEHFVPAKEKTVMRALNEDGMGVSLTSLPDPDNSILGIWPPAFQVFEYPKDDKITLRHTSSGLSIMMWNADATSGSAVFWNVQYIGSSYQIDVIDKYETDTDGKVIVLDPDSFPEDVKTDIQSNISQGYTKYGMLDVYYADFEIEEKIKRAEVKGDVDAAALILESSNPSPDVKTSILARRQSSAKSQNWGHNLFINAGGNLILGSGEFAQNAEDYGKDGVNGTTEHLYIGSDGTIRIYTNGGSRGTSDEPWDIPRIVIARDGDICHHPTADIVLSFDEPDNFDRAQNTGGLRMYNIDTATKTHDISNFMGAVNGRRRQCDNPYKDTDGSGSGMPDTEWCDGLEMFAQHSEYNSSTNAWSYSYNGVYIGKGVDSGRSYVVFHDPNAWRRGLGIGQKITQVDSGSKSIPNNSTSVDFCSFTPEYSGVYLVQIGVNWAANSTGCRKVGVSTTANTWSNDRFKSVTDMASNNGSTMQKLMFATNLTAGTRYYVHAYQNSGAALSGSCLVEGYRIC